MDITELRQLVEAIVRRELGLRAESAAGDPESQPRGRLLLLVTGTRSGWTESVRQVSLLRHLGYACTAGLSYSAQRLFAGDEAAAQLGCCCQPPDGVERLSLDGIDAVALLTVTTNTINKVALGMTDAPVPGKVISALAGGLPVLAADAADCPFAELEHRSPALHRLLARRRRTAEEFGVRFVAADRLADAVRELFESSQTHVAASAAASQVVTADDVRRAAEAGQPIILSARAVVTPLARDLAAQMNVELRRP